MLTQAANWAAFFIYMGNTLTGLTGAPIHPGSWSLFGQTLPDLGVTELLQGKKTTTPSLTGLTYTLGEPAAQPTINNTPNPKTTSTSVNLQKAANSGGLTVDPTTVTKGTLQTFYPGYAGWDPEAAWADFQKTGGAGKGGASVGGSSGGGGSSSNFKVDSNVNLDNGTSDYFKSLVDAANSGDEAARAQIDTLYAERDAKLQSQLDQANTDYQNSLTDVNNQVDTNQTDVNRQKTEAQQATDTAIGQAGATAQSVQRSNRNVLRALGILNSTYAGDKLQEPMNQFDQQRATLSNTLLQQVNKLDDYMNQVKTQADSFRRQLLSQYTTIKGNIEGDLRFNQKEKADALIQAKAALNQRLSEISSSQTSYLQQADQAKKGFAATLASMQLQKNPSADISGILKSSIAAANALYNPQQVSIATPTTGQTADQRRKLSSTNPYGLDINSAVNSGGLTF